MKFTEANVKSFETPAGKTDHYEWDDSMPGFGFRCRTAGGSKVYLVKYRVGEKQRKLTLGATNKVTLESARANARQIFGKVAMNEDPASELARKAIDAAHTFDVVTDRYLEAIKPDTADTHFKNITRTLQVRCKAMHGLSVKGIDRAAIASELQTIKKVNGPVAMNTSRSHLSKFFGWVISEGYRDVNPVDNTNKAETSSRERVLEDDELKQVWRALPDGDFGKIVRLLMLTSQRRNEIAHLEISEFNREKRQIELPKERTKNGLPHVVPLSDAAFNILASIDTEGKKFFFGRSPERSPFSGFGNCKDVLDLEVKIPHWTLHDLRRTSDTRMNDSGIFPHIVEAVLNHQSGSKKGVAGVYNKAQYLKEKREALNALASYVAGVVG